MNRYYLKAKSRMYKWMFIGAAIMSLLWWTSCTQKNTKKDPLANDSLPVMEEKGDTMEYDVDESFDSMAAVKKEDKTIAKNKNLEKKNVKRDSFKNAVKDTIQIIRKIDEPVCEYGPPPNYGDD